MSPEKFVKKQLTGAQVLLKTLADSGIEYMFGYTGGAIMPTFDTLPQYPQIKFITCRNEQGAGFMAQGYARACGKIAPILVTSGPGAANILTTVADGMMDSVPMLAITGQVASQFVGTDAFQETDIVGMMYPITKYAVMPLSADEVSKSTSQLLFIANNGRKGPVNLDIPKDVQNQKTSIILPPKNLDLPGFKLPLDYKLKENLEKIKPSLKDACELIKNSQRPIALVGHGIILGDCQKELAEFLVKGEIPAGFTLHGLSSFPASNPLNLGLIGMHGELEANYAIRDSDLIIALGMRFDDRVTGKLSEFGKQAKIIHIEIDPSEINKSVKVDVAINANLKDVLSELTNLLKTKTAEKVYKIERENWLMEIEKNKQKSKELYAEIFKIDDEKTGQLSMARIIHELSEFTSGDDNLVTDVGQHQMFSAKFYKFEKFNSWFTSGGAGTMGFGIPASIGVKIARPKEEVWCVVGDGSIQMNIQELGTILQENLNINILLLNNSYLGMVRQWQQLFHENRYVETEMIGPKYDHLTKAYNLGYRKVEKISEIKDALAWSKKEKRSTIVEFICQQKEMVWPMLPPGGSYKDIIEGEKHASEVLNKSRA